MSRPRIIVGLDESVGARTAVQWAADECRFRGCTLLIVTAVGPDPRSALPYGGQPTDGAADLLLTSGAAAASLRQRGVPVTTLLRNGAPAETLIELSRGAEILVIGAAGAWTSSLSSVGRQVVERSHCPVAVIPGNWRASRADGSSHIGISDELIDTAVEQFADDEANARGIALQTISAEDRPSDALHRAAERPDLVVLRRLGGVHSTTSSGAPDASADLGWPCPVVYVDGAYPGHSPAADGDAVRELVR